MSNNYKDASELLWQELSGMTFTDLADYVGELRDSVRKLQTQLVEAEVTIKELDTEPQVAGLREQLAAMETVADMWVDVANDLYEGLMVAQEQLSKHGIGLRPVAQDAMRLFAELTEEWDDDGDD